VTSDVKDIGDDISSSDGVWTVAGGRFRVHRNSSGGISLDFGDGEFDMDTDEAVELAAALSGVAHHDDPPQTANPL